MAPRKQTSDWRKLHRYCGKDVAYTAALGVVYIERARKAGLLDVYHDHYRLLGRACVELTLTGFPVDEDERTRLAMEHQEKLYELIDQLEHVIGEPLRTWWKANRGGTPGRIAKVRPVAKKGLSNPYLATFFYDVLGCRIVDKREGRTTKELVLRRLRRRLLANVRDVGQQAIDLILAFRHHQKIIEFTAKERIADDGRFHSLYTPTAKTNRLRSRKTPAGDGGNGQNIPRPTAETNVRKMFVPFPGHVLVEVDESQAEDRLVGGMSGDARALELARSSPLDVDVHALRATAIFAERESTLPWEVKRQLGKRTKHAINYGEGPQMMADTALVETEGELVLDVDECKEWQETLLAAEPSVGMYQAWIRRQLWETGKLTSSWGLTSYWRGLRITTNDQKEAYARPPQHEVGVLMNQWGFLAARKLIRDESLDARIVQQGHDSLVVSVAPRHAWTLVEYLSRSLSRPRDYPGARGSWSLAMPIGVKLGSNWGEMHEWKILPKRDEFRDHVRALEVRRVA